ncbi:hypothetical protein BIW11_06743 [Tropilaelaps mercedesae]|uniref:Chitin-binding type-2 domain-containing protein n=1 Tax=Tropilaelaps mercedesae TaxID=418985 RepID=A0A1V9XWZ0_9ACAR|nr:hypothetical protein BIW11_06743 [Tropilaelaps mercedesae]
MKFFTTVCCFVALLVLGAQTKPSVFGPGSPDCPPYSTINEQKVPDSNDCTKYSKCSIWFAAKFACKPGEHFSPSELKCMSPWKAGCDPAYATTTPESTTEAVTVTEGPSKDAPFIAALTTATVTKSGKANAASTKATKKTASTGRTDTETTLAEGVRTEAAPFETAFTETVKTDTALIDAAKTEAASFKADETNTTEPYTSAPETLAPKAEAVPTYAKVTETIVGNEIILASK